jgi:predicted phage replisome organizer
LASDVKWIKICTDIFDDEKMALIDAMPERDAITVIWFKLLCLAGKQNNGGVFMLNDRIAYTDEMLATIFRRPLNTVRLALNTFDQFGMVNIINNAYTIPNWEKHQSLDKLEAAKEKNRLRVAAHREKQKQLAQCNDYSNGTVMPCNDAEKEEDKELELDKDKEERIDYQQIVDLYHSICISYQKIRSLSDSRKKAIKARLNTYTVDDFKTVFENAEASSFLKGKNDRNWTATFDWLIADKNMAKVLEGNYTDRTRGKEKVPDWFKKQRELDEDEVAAINRMLTDEDLAEVEQLRQKVQSWRE